ncbi:MAG: Glu/Leu/Phe/Val dehydrogenase dimerization domain-containing protein [Pseudomonadota bacterium]|nr:Glu/Leu/Phe/Val dehydrogenase dimerization domain-containing protein [Pseudomonadota bacterium]
MSQNSSLRVPEFGRKTARGCMDLFTSAEAYGCSEIHFWIDPGTQLKAIIAIHSTRLGPAVGGCRCRSYPSTEDAVEDALRLARGMTLKAALAALPCGGGKAVLIRPATIRDRQAYFESFGDFVESLHGLYATAVDSGTSIKDMDIIARRTRHVLSTSEDKGGSGDPSPFTAKGVRLGIEAAVKHALKRNTLEGTRVAIQGVGHVGYALARELRALGARLTVADTHADHVLRCNAEFGARIVSPESIYDVPCDVFAPCALGGIINDTTINRINTRIIAGAANNQLEDERHGQLLHQRGILFVPDYLINAGGLIHVLISDQGERDAKLRSMINTLNDLFAQSAHSDTAPFLQATLMAENILGMRTAA